MHGPEPLHKHGGDRYPLIVLLAPPEEGPIIVVQLGALLIINPESHLGLLDILILPILDPPRIQYGRLVPHSLIVHAVNNVALLNSMPPLPIIRIRLRGSKHCGGQRQRNYLGILVIKHLDVHLFISFTLLAFHSIILRLALKDHSAAHPPRHHRVSDPCLL